MKPTKTAPAVSEALRLIRVLHGKKLRELSTEVGVSSSYLSEIENGHKRPTLELLAAYAKAFDTTSSVIMFFAEELDDHGEDTSHAAMRTKMLLFLQAVERFALLKDD